MCSKSVLHVPGPFIRENQHREARELLLCRIVPGTNREIREWPIACLLIHKAPTVNRP